jgi:hypothetical protein
VRQLNDPDECDAIKKSGVHHVLYETGNGLQGLALASAAICASIRPIVEGLVARDRQHLVRIQSLSGRKRRFTITDPTKEPPSAYWR